MMKKQFATVCVMLAIVLSWAVEPVSADRGRGRGGNRYDDRHEEKYYRDRGYRIDNRYHHNRYYPPRGGRVKVLPRGYRVVPYRGLDYYFHSGVWYLSSGAYFSVVMPPVGLVVSVLPPYYTTVWVGGLPYYYAGGVYYTWRPERRAYVVTNPPPESEVVEQPAEPEQLFVYPQHRQNEDQQAADRYECHSWAAEQTGFDPTMPGGNVPVEQNAAKRADYNRAMKACLEARGYSVQ